MALQARYDPQQDRMRLILRPAEGPLRAFWVTRRQWLGLLHALSAGQPAAAEQAAPALPPKPRQLANSPESLAPEPVPLQTIRLRRMAEGMKLMLVIDKNVVTLDIPAAGIVQVQAMLRQQAERAGWDTDAALARLSAAREANTAVERARKLH
jgi:hypothetical protein